VWEITKGSGIITPLVSFSGVHPTSLIMDSQGNLFGTTSGNEGPNGFVFEIVAGSNTATTLASFSGDNPGGLTMDAQGNLYGTFRNTVWELSSGSKIVATLATLDAGIGLNGSLTVGADGQIYGTTNSGGDYGDGSVFEVIKTPEPSSLVVSVGSILVGALSMKARRPPTLKP
jgi:hypothetical protein